MNNIKQTSEKDYNVSLKIGSGQSLHDKVRGKYWHIYLGEQRAGKIYIDYNTDEVLGNHPSIDIFINKQFQGQHIGRIAYALACEESGLDEIYMHSRKSNIASIKAAADAGFIELQRPEFRQVVMVWKKERGISGVSEN